MRKIIVVASGILLAMTFAGSAIAAVTLDGAVACSGTPPFETCAQDISCSSGICVVNTPNPSTETNATCNDAMVGSTGQFTAAHIDQGPNPVCEWSVQDDDNNPITVTIDSSDGLPVELTTFSVE